MRSAPVPRALGVFGGLGSSPPNEFMHVRTPSGKTMASFPFISTVGRSSHFLIRMRLKQ